MNERLDKQMDFIREIDKEKFITRMTKLTDGKRRENDAEHAWHMAIMTILLSEYANEKIDVLRTVTMLLIHDLVEIDAAKKLYDIWLEFEAKETPEAKFARAMDNLQPMMLTASTGGFDWKDRGVRAEQVMKRNEITPEGSKTLWYYAYENFLKPNIENGNLQ